MGQLSGSHGIGQLERPQFNQNQLNELKQSGSNQEESSKAVDKQTDKKEDVVRKKKRSDELTVGMLDDIDELENEDMVRINIEDINKSINSLNFGEFAEHYLPNRDSNSTQKSNSSTDSQKISKLIQIPKLKYIQRFCQFKISKEQMNESEDEHEIEAKIEAMIEKYIESGGGQKQNEEKCRNMRLAALTYKRETNICTALFMFDNECNENADEWIDNFLAYPDIAELVDKEADPIFTQLSAN